MPKFWEFSLCNNHYQTSINEGNQSFKLSASAWFLQKLALKVYYCCSDEEGPAKKILTSKAYVLDKKAEYIF